MHPQDAIDLVRQALLTALLISAPVLATGLVVGLVVGLIQALTQIQDQTIAFVPKLIAMILVLSFTLPWLISHLAEYTRELVENIPRAL
jgi:flagellar biosynthesis protein FliQ